MTIQMIRQRACSFRADKQGLAAVEFAMVVPFMLTLYLGGAELGDGMAIGIKVSETAHILADLATQNTSINNALMTSILGASSATIAPYAAANAKITISEVTTNSSGVATVTWSDSLNGTPRTVGQTITLPTAIAGTPSISLILGEVSYTYTPPFAAVITGTLTLSDSYFLYPRNSTSITRVNS